MFNCNRVVFTGTLMELDLWDLLARREPSWVLVSIALALSAKAVQPQLQSKGRVIQSCYAIQLSWRVVL